MTTLPYDNQALTRTGRGEQGAAHGQGTELGRLVQHVDEAGGLSDSLPQHQCQQYALLVRTHTASS
ncbi:hypothetical protein D3C72_1954970 [compost metagenome]